MIFVWNYSFLDVMFLKWVVFKISMLVFGDCIIIFVFWYWFVVYFVWSSIFVFVFFWLDFRFFILIYEFFVKVMYFFLFLNLFLMISWVFFWRCFCLRLYMEWVRKLYKFFLLFGLEIYLFYCLGMGVVGFLMYFFSVFDEFFFVCFFVLMELLRCWLKIMWM